jgi:hypothetical protein
MSGNLQRELASRLAPTDTVRALAAARAITDPWYACQALAWVARFAAESEFSRIIQDSLRVVRDEADAYRVVAASAWPIRAIVERNHLEMLPSIVPDLLRRAEDIEILASRSEALFLIFQAIFPAGSKHWRPVLESLRRASTQLMSWRQRRNLLDAIMIVRGEDEKLALEITNSIDDQKLKGKIERTWAASEPRLPRPFFWATNK